VNAAAPVELVLAALEAIGPAVETRGHHRRPDQRQLGERPDCRYNDAMLGHLRQADLTPEQLRLFRAGDAVDGTPASVEGAVQTALNAVWGATTHLGGGTASENPGPDDVGAEPGPVAFPD
jgi:hypothetical protein